MQQLIVAVLAPGSMGSALGARMVSHGARVLTSVEGRSVPSRARATAAGLVSASDEEIAGADILLSIVPPADSRAVAARFAPVLARAPRKPLFADCNAVDVATVTAIADLIIPTGATFVDGGIIGGPPTSNTAGPKLYCSGEAAKKLICLTRYGVDVRVLEGPIGAASALKMSYAGITKGLAAIGAAMILAAARAGAAAALRDELADSQPQLLARFETALPDMYPKAHRWAGEMREIAAFLSEDEGATAMFKGAAELYERFAQEQSGERARIKQIDAFLGSGSAVPKSHPDNDAKGPTS